MAAHPVDPVVARLLRRRDAGHVLRRYGVVRFRRCLFGHIRSGDHVIDSIVTEETPAISALMREVFATAMY